MKQSNKKTNKKTVQVSDNQEDSISLRNFVRHLEDALKELADNDKIKALEIIYSLDPHVDIRINMQRINRLESKDSTTDSAE
jgi:hypothetical protein